MAFGDIPDVPETPVGGEFGGQLRENCCILRQIIIGNGRFTFYDKNGNVYTGRGSNLSSQSGYLGGGAQALDWDFGELSHATWEMKIEEQLCSRCIDGLPCTGVDLFDPYNPSPIWSCEQELEALNKELEAGMSTNSGGGTGARPFDNEKFGFEFLGFKANGCCDCPGEGSEKNNTYEMTGEVLIAYEPSVTSLRDVRGEAGLDVIYRLEQSEVGCCGDQREQREWCKDPRPEGTEMF